MTDRANSFLGLSASHNVQVPKMMLQQCHDPMFLVWNPQMEVADGCFDLVIEIQMS